MLIYLSRDSGNSCCNSKCSTLMFSGARYCMTLQGRDIIRGLVVASLSVGEHYDYEFFFLVLL